MNDIYKMAGSTNNKGFNICGIDMSISPRCSSHRSQWDDKILTCGQVCVTHQPANTFLILKS